MEVVVAAISAGISLAALVVSIVVARRQTAIQERLAAIEEMRRAEEVEARGQARVTVSIAGAEPPQAMLVTAVTVTQPAPRWLVLHNGGPALARSVQAAVQEGPPMPQVLGLEVLPVDLQPGQAMIFLVTAGEDATTTMQVTVRWTDETGDHEEPFTLQVL